MNREPVLIIHDLYLAASVRKIGLAIYLVHSIEHVAIRVPVQKVVSVCPTACGRARALFGRLGFSTGGSLSNAETVAVYQNVSRPDNLSNALRERDTNRANDENASAAALDKSGGSSPSRLLESETTTLIRIAVKAGYICDRKSRLLGDFETDRAIDSCLDVVRTKLLQQARAVAKQGRKLDWFQVTLR